MASIFRSLLFVIAGATQRELARQVRYLKVENELLRSSCPARITVTAKERQRLLKFGAKLGKAIHQVVTIVTPRTFLRWIRKDRRGGRKKAVKRGRRRSSSADPQSHHQARQRKQLELQPDRWRTQKAADPLDLQEHGSQHSQGVRPRPLPQAIGQHLGRIPESSCGQFVASGLPESKGLDRERDPRGFHPCLPPRRNTQSDLFAGDSASRRGMGDGAGGGVCETGSRKWSAGAPCAA